ncbi:MAG: hypothetical protein LUB59_00880 [Candidatus Gastranaerophilales bacterium]|nr:hypothetical protein [Candidatus Gastranaerophilales bacterium]
MECPKCGNEVKDTDKVCPFCKKVLLLECPICHKLSRTAVCEECGYVIIVKCNKCGTAGPNILGKCRKCGFDTAKSVIMNEAETEEYACLAITFPNLEDLRPALKNKTIFNKFKKKLKQALFGYAKSQENRAQAFGETYVIKYYKEFSLTSSVKKAVKSAIELLNKIGGISYKLKKSKNVRLHCKMTILKKTFDTDTNEFNTGLNIKLIKDNTVEKYTDGLQLITDQYVNNIISREYTLEMIYSSQVGDELLMFYEFPLEDQIIPIVEEEKVEDTSILKGPKDLPKLKIYDDDDTLNEMLYGSKPIDITTEGQFLSVPAHNIFNILGEILAQHSFVALKTTERRDLPTSDLLNFFKSKSANVLHVACKDNFKYKPYSFFRGLIARHLHLDLKQKDFAQKAKAALAGIDNDNLMLSLLTNNISSDIDPDSAFILYRNQLREFLASHRDSIIFIENFDLIDETSLQIISDYISTLINLEDLSMSFVVTVRSDYSVYKNIPKLLHSPFYKEINVTKGDYNAFLATIDEDIEEIKETFYFQKLEERCAGSLTYFKNELRYMKDANIFITFEGKLMINAEKTIVFPGTIKELFARRFKILPESEGLVIAYTILLEGHAHISLLEKLNIENLQDAIKSLVDRSLIIFEDNIVVVQNLRIFKRSLNKVLEPETKQLLAKNIIDNIGCKSLELLKILGLHDEKLPRIYECAISSLSFGDFASYLNCAKYYFNLLDELKIKDEEAIERKNELYSILVNHLNRYPSTKVYNISKSILANATKNNDDETIVNVSNLVLDSALSGSDYVLAKQCIENILTRILNPKLVAGGQDFTPQFILYSCIYARIAFNLSKYSQCITICDKVISTITPEFISLMVNNGVDKDEFLSYVMDVLVFSAMSRIIICDGSLGVFLEKVKEKLDREILSGDYLTILEKLLHHDEFDIDAGISNDEISMFISNILIAFQNFEEGYNTFAQNVYKAKLSLTGNNMKLLTLLCDLLIGYSYQKIILEQKGSWKKCETIYDDVYRISQKSGFSNMIQLTNWFKSSLLKDKELYEEAYDLISTVSNTLKHSHSKNRLLVFITYVLMLNIVCNIEERKTEIPALIYRIKYDAERHNFEGYYKYIDDQNLLDPEYLEQFKAEIAAEQVAMDEEENAEAEADEKENEDAAIIDGAASAIQGETGV